MEVLVLLQYVMCILLRSAALRIRQSAAPPETDPGLFSTLVFFLFFLASTASQAPPHTSFVAHPGAPSPTSTARGLPTLQPLLLRPLPLFPSSLSPARGGPSPFLARGPAKFSTAWSTKVIINNKESYSNTEQ